MRGKIYGLLFLISSSVFAAEFSLQEALEYAEKSNNLIVEKRLENENINLDFQNSKIERLPSFSWSSGMNKNADSESYSHSLSVKQSIYKGNAITNGIDKSKLLKEKSQLELLNEIESVKLEVIKYYMTALKYQNQLEIYNSSFEELKNQYEKQTILYENKLISKSELLELQSQIIEIESSIIEVKNSYRIQIEQLKNSIQYKTDETLTLKMPSVEIEGIRYETDLQALSVNNLDIKIGELDRKISAKNIEIQKSDYLPDVSLSFSYSSSDKELGNSLGEWDWRAGLSFSYELFDWGETKNAVKQSKNSYEINKLKQKETAEQAEFALKTKYYELEKYEKQLEAQRKLIEARQEQYKLAKIKYENRYIDTNTYISSKNDMTKSELELVNLETEYYIAYKEYLNILN